MSDQGGKRLLDYLVGADEDRLRHSKAERIGGLQIDDQLECRWLLKWEIVRCRASEDPPDVGCSRAEGHCEARSIADKPTRRNVFAPHRRNGITCCERYQVVAAAVEKRI